MCVHAVIIIDLDSNEDHDVMRSTNIGDNFITNPIYDTPQYELLQPRFEQLKLAQTQTPKTTVAVETRVCVAESLVQLHQSQSNYEIV